jgi:uncharacterized protein YlaI
MHKCEVCKIENAAGFFEDFIYTGDKIKFTKINTYLCKDCAQPFIENGEKFNRIMEVKDAETPSN